MDNYTLGEEQSFENFNIRNYEIMQSALNDPKLYHTYAVLTTPSTSFHMFYSRTSHFPDVQYFRTFPLTSILKDIFQLV